MTNHKDNFAKNFLKCGLTGWCMEIIFTSLHSISQKDLTLKGVTSIWMFPIYGCAALIAPVSRKLSGIPMVFRGLIYMTAIFTTEYSAGMLLSRHKVCPWDYGTGKWCINHLVRLDYAPYWFSAGLFFEKLLNPQSKTKEHPSGTTLHT